MPSSERRRASRFAVALLAVAALTASDRAAAQTPNAEGFAVERLYLSAPGAGWFVMDDLAMHGGLGAVAAMTAGYAANPLRLTDGTQHLALVSDQAFVDFGFAATYDRFRLYVTFDVPLLIQGSSGAIGGRSFTAPAVDPGSHPDTLSDPRIGFDARLLGAPGGAFRLGAGAQLFVPNGVRTDYDTDGTYRAMLRLLAAGDVGAFRYAAHLGLHLRPLDDPPTPGRPQGSELLFGAAAGPSFPLGAGGRTALVIGPEVYGETALGAFLGKTTTGVEGLVTGRLEGTAGDGPALRLKLGAGGGLDASFGAPEWRVVFGLEVFDHTRR